MKLRKLTIVLTIALAIAAGAQTANAGGLGGPGASPTTPTTKGNFIALCQGMGDGDPDWIAPVMGIDALPYAEKNAVYEACFDRIIEGGYFPSNGLQPWAK